MSNARLILVLLLCASPAIVLFDGAIMHGVLAGAAAVGIAIVSRTMRPGETEFFVSVARAAAPFAAVPALWMLLQVLPFGPLAHSIWSSAAAALGHPVTGTISIDIGATVMALGEYLTILAVAFWSAAVAVDRQRAEWILFALMTATALIGLTVAAAKPFGLPYFRSKAPASDLTQAIDCVALGVIIATGAMIRTIERYETRQASPNRSVSRLLQIFAACVVALAVCVVVLIISAPVGILVATAFGLGALASVVLIRRLGLGTWGILAIAVPSIGIAAFLVAGEPALHTTSFPLAFATEAPAALTSMSQRILNEAPLTGTGGGTFTAIAPIYREIDDQAPVYSAPTAAAAIAVELGRPMFWLIIATTVGAIFVLLRAALRRGRDSFYPAAGASCLITLSVLCFMNAGILGTGAAMITAATIGLAFAQSKSRTIRQ